MNGRRIGEHLLYRVEEMSGPLLVAKDLFPDMTPEMMEAEKSWFEPQWFDRESGCLQVSFHSWVLKTKHHTILIDTCAGNHKERDRALYNNLNTPYLERLRAVGVEPEAVDIVMCSHLHVDHVGWNTQLKDGRWVPTFPNAKYIWSRTDHDYWRTKAKMHPPRGDFTRIYNDSVLPVLEANQAVMVTDGYQVDDGMVIRMAHGHSPGHIVMEVRSGDDSGVFIGDVIHTAMQIRYPDLCTGADWDKDLARASRRRVLEQIADTPTLLLPTHFPAPFIGHVKRDRDSYRFDFLK